MKTNPNDAAFASSLRERGLTKLEYMATQIMQGLASRAIHADNSLADFLNDREILEGMIK
ncbi:MAG: hypothetical protein IPI17_02145 [Nitrosomonas sp.]|nr:hypothetical protein [Nitrosomonas sp.]